MQQGVIFTLGVMFGVVLTLQLFWDALHQELQDYDLVPVGGLQDNQGV